MRKKVQNNLTALYKRSGIYLISITLLFLFIGIFTTIQPAFRISSQAITDWTSEIDSATFLYLIGMENRAFQEAYPEDQTFPSISNVAFQIATSVKPDDPRSLLGNEVPGFSIFDNRLFIAGEGTNYTNLSIESSPPLEEVLRDREAVVEEDANDSEQTPVEETEDETNPTTGERDVVFIYNTHNRESFLPHLPGVTEPDSAFHKDVNITLVSERLKASLEAEGIGTHVDETDVTNYLNENDMSYGQSYEASRSIVEEAFSANQEIQYVFDLHRDSIGRDLTTKEIDGEQYGRIMIVVGTDYSTYEKNMEFATQLHNLLEEKYPGLSRGILPKGGSLTNGVFNQDLSENALLFEFGGIENNLEEVYRSADALAEVFSELYWDAEKVDSESE